MNLKTLLGQLRLLAILEGISFISLGLTMVLKYKFGMPGPNYVVGMAHGVLFIAYVIWLLVNHNDRKWSLKTTAILFLSSLLPFGTFVADAKILKKEEAIQK